VKTAVVEPTKIHNQVHAHDDRTLKQHHGRDLATSIAHTRSAITAPGHVVECRRPSPQASPQNAAQIVPKCHNEKAGLVAQLSRFVGREAHCRSILRKKPGDEPGFSVSISVTTAAASISYCRIIM
jgi:hypothetical protein